MSNNLASFQSRIKQYCQNIERNAVEVQKDIAQQVLAEVVEVTPIDTGRAMSNWLVNSGSAANYSLPEAHTPGQSGTTRAANMQQAIAEGDDQISRHRGGELHITNNLDYVVELNEIAGKTKQANPHFVEAAVLAASKTGIKRSILSSSPNSRVV